MSKLFVSEFPGLATTDQSDSVAIFAAPPTLSYSVIVSAGVSQGPVLQPSTKFIEVSTDTTCSFTVVPTAAPAAGLNDVRLAPNERLIRRVPFQQQTAGPGTYQVLSTAYSVCTTANV